MYVYLKSEDNLWTVGFYSPAGEWVPESDWNMAARAADRVHYLNGGDPDDAYAPAPTLNPSSKRLAEIASDDMEGDV